MSAAANYRALFTRGGRRVTIERLVANSDPLSVENVRVRIRGASPEEIAGGVKATARRALVLAEDIPAAFRPLKSGDRIVTQEGTMMITEKPDDQTHRDGELLLAYDCMVA